MLGSVTLQEGLDVRYSGRTLLVLVIARVTGWKVERAYSFVRGIASWTIRSGRKGKGTSDKSPR